MSESPSPSPTEAFLASHPSAVLELKAREASINSETPPTPPPSAIPELRFLAAELEAVKDNRAHLAAELDATKKIVESLRTKLKRASSTISTLASSEAHLSAQADHASLYPLTKGTIIGGGDNATYHPGSLDIHLEEIGTWPSSTLLAGFPRYIAWVPVPIFPFPVRGKYGPEIGRTSIRESLAFPFIPIPSIRDPSSPADYTLSQFCISGFASLTLVPRVRPEDMAQHLDSIEIRGHGITYTDPQDHPDSNSQPAFIPSQATPSPTPDSRVPFIPTQTR